MYSKRIKIFIIISVLLILPCLLRLIQIQVLSYSFYMEGITELKLQQGVSRQLKTIRGKILDRKGRVLATNEPQFQLHINYNLSCTLDDRVRRAKLLRLADRSMLAGAKPSLLEERKKLEAKLDELQKIIDKCTYFAHGEIDIEEQITSINNKIWNLRTFLAWRRNRPDQKIIAKYKGRISNVPLSEAIADFEKQFPDQDERLLEIEKIQYIPEMNRGWRLVELKTDADVFDAQLEFMDIEGIEILPKSRRIYPYGSVAAQTIGWVGPPQERDRQIFENDKLSSYMSEEVCGREDGVEYVCETILRGRRGEEVYDIDRELISRTETQFGKDITTTLDIELQMKIEDYLADCNHNPNCSAPMATVVIDVNTGDILALVSMPTFDLNRVRSDYGDLSSDSNEPLRNRAINKAYPPGSVVKPLILTAGLQSGKITPEEIISCPAQKAPKGWPSCWLFNQYQSGHDYKWQNYARNAIRGSCNIYFSRLADRIDSSVLQLWLFKFGYGHEIPLAPQFSVNNNENWAPTIEHRDLRQGAGQISTGIVKGNISSFQQIPPLQTGEKRLFGIGQGNLRATPLQVANAIAAIARGGVYKPPRLFLDSPQTNTKNLHRTPIGGASSTENRVSSIENRASRIENRESGINLNISPRTLDVIYDGMSAVVNEPSGTAYAEFVQSSLPLQGVKVYGKTGSTEQPSNAWFAGFATDNAGRKLSIAVLVEGGQRGSQDAAPLAHDILQFCIDAGHLEPIRITPEWPI